MLGGTQHGSRVGQTAPERPGRCSPERLATWSSLIGAEWDRRPVRLAAAASERLVQLWLSFLRGAAARELMYLWHRMLAGLQPQPAGS